MSVAVIILTFNEEKNIVAALESVIGWANEIFVVDSFSTDGTVDKALSYTTGNVRVVQHAFDNYSAQWNWAINNLPIMSRWTLKLDADERVTEAFRCEVASDILLDESIDGVYFRRRFFFMGEPLRWGGLSSNYDLRLWRTGRAAFEDRTVNEHVLVTGKTVRMSAYVDHLDFKSLSDWLAKHNRYSSMEAIARHQGNITGQVRPNLFGRPDERRMFLRRIYQQTPFGWILYFLYRYVVRLGFLDGVSGFRYEFLHATYFWWTALKMAEIERTGDLPEISWPARGQPHPGVQPPEPNETI